LDYKYEIQVGSFFLDTNSWEKGAQQGSYYEVFQIDGYGDTTARIFEELAKGTTLNVRLQLEEKGALVAIGTAIEAWRANGVLNIKVLVSEWH
jgi:hypothetical protein